MGEWRKTTVAGVAIACLVSCATGTAPRDFSVNAADTPVQQPVRTVTLEARLVISPYRGLLAVVTPWAATDIDHVRLELFQGTTSKGTVAIPQAQLGGVVRINNLAPNTAYTIRSRAWQDAAETVPIDNYDLNAASCTTAFGTTTDDVVSLGGGIALRLRDKTFSGLGTGAISVTAGTLVAAGAEALTQNVVGVVTTLAGSGTFGHLNATGIAARFYAPQGICADAAGNLYVADTGNYRIRKVTPAGVVTTFAGTGGYGNGEGTTATASFQNPWDVAIDGAGNVYVTDFDVPRVRMISTSGTVTTLAGSTSGYADGTGAAAQFNRPRGMAADAAGNVYVADHDNALIRKITPAGVVTTVAGVGVGWHGFADGSLAEARFNRPADLALDPAGNLYIADSHNHRIRKLTPGGVVTTLAGSTAGYADGTGTAAQFNLPVGLTLDAMGNLYVADANNHRIRKVTPGGLVTTVAGASAGYADGSGAGALFNSPTGITADGAGNLYVGDQSNHRIRKVI